MWPNVSAALRARVLTPLSKRLEGRLGQHILLGVTIGRDSSHGELVAVPVVGSTLAVDAQKEWSALGE